MNEVGKRMNSQGHASWCRHALNIGARMTNAWPVIIQQQVCRRWEPGEGKEKGPFMGTD